MVIHGWVCLIIVLADRGIIEVASTAIPAAATCWHICADSPTRYGQEVQTSSTLTVSEATTQLRSTGDDSLFPVRAQIGGFVHSHHIGCSADAPVPQGSVLSHPSGWLSEYEPKRGTTGLVGQYLGGTAHGGMVSIAALLPTDPSFVALQPGLTTTGSLVLDMRPKATSAHIRTRDAWPVAVCPPTGASAPALAQIASLR